MYIDLNWFFGLYTRGTYKTLVVVILTLIAVAFWIRTESVFVKTII